MNFNRDLQFKMKIQYLFSHLEIWFGPSKITCGIKKSSTLISSTALATNWWAVWLLRAALPKTTTDEILFSIRVTRSIFFAAHAYLNEWYVWSEQILTFTSTEFVDIPLIYLFHNSVSFASFDHARLGVMRTCTINSNFFAFFHTGSITMPTLK